MTPAASAGEQSLACVEIASSGIPKDIGTMKCALLAKIRYFVKTV